MWLYCRNFELEEMLRVMGIIALHIISFIIVHCDSKSKRFAFMTENDLYEKHGYVDGVNTLVSPDRGCR